MKKLNYSIVIFFLLTFISFSVYSKDFIIEGNNYSDDEIIKSIISDLPQSDDKTIIVPPKVSTPTVFELKSPYQNIQGRVR